MNYLTNERSLIRYSYQPDKKYGNHSIFILSLSPPSILNIILLWLLHFRHLQQLRLQLSKHQCIRLISPYHRRKPLLRHIKALNIHRSFLHIQYPNPPYHKCFIHAHLVEVVLGRNKDTVCLLGILDLAVPGLLLLGVRGREGREGGSVFRFC